MYETGKIFVTADGTPMNVYGMSKINIKFGNQWVRHNVIIANISNDGLIGIDFLVQHGIKIDFAKQTIHVEGEEILAQCRSTRNESCRVAISEGVMIPAGTRRIIQAKTSYPLATGSWLVEPLQKTHGESPVLLARTLIQGDGFKLPVEVMNPTEEDSYLYPGTNVGIVTRVSPLECDQEDPQDELKELPPEVERLVQEIDVPLSAEQKTQTAKQPPSFHPSW